MGFLSGIGSLISKGASAASNIITSSGWELLPMVASMGVEWYSQEQLAEKAGEAGAEVSRVQGLNRAYQQKIFEENIERQRPFYEAGMEALPKYKAAVAGKLDPTESGIYKMRAGLLEEDLADAPEYIREKSMKRLAAEEEQKIKPRLMDIIQTGMGAAGEAGRASVNLGTALAKSYGATSVAGQKYGQAASEIRQSAWGKAADVVSGLPSYFASK